MTVTVEETNLSVTVEEESLSVTVTEETGAVVEVNLGPAGKDGTGFAADGVDIQNTNIGAVKIGGVVDPANLSQFGADGSFRMYGDATVWRDDYRDLLVQTRNNPSAKLTENVAEGTLDYTDSAGLNDYARMGIQLNHDWKPGTTIYPHLHFFQAEDALPNWLVQYRWQINGEAKVTDWTNLPLDEAVFDYVSGVVQIASNAAGITPADWEISDILQFRLIRDTGNDSGEFSGSDPYTGTVSALSFDIHYEIDSIGSFDEYSKYGS
jgi:hypothetical protein